MVRAAHILCAGCNMTDNFVASMDPYELYMAETDYGTVSVAKGEKSSFFWVSDQYDWTDTVPGDITYPELSARWDSNFRQGERGKLTFHIERSPIQSALAHIPLHSWFSDITGPLTVHECANEIASKLKKEGYEQWAPMEVDGDDVTVYLVAGSAFALVAIGVVALFGIGLLVNWTVQTITVSRIKRQYNDEAIEAAKAGDYTLAEWLAGRADTQEFPSLFGAAGIEDVSDGFKTAIIIVAVAAAVVVLVVGLSKG